jgi:predicted ATPase
MALMTRSLLGTAEMPPALQALVVRKAEGNPFFVEEVTRSLIEDGSLRPERDGFVLTREIGEVSIPDTIQPTPSRTCSRRASTGWPTTRAARSRSRA